MRLGRGKADTCPEWIVFRSEEDSWGCPQPQLLHYLKLLNCSQGFSAQATLEWLHQRVKTGILGSFPDSDLQVAGNLGCFIMQSNRFICSQFRFLLLVFVGFTSWLTAIYIKGVVLLAVELSAWQVRANLSFCRTTVPTTINHNGTKCCSCSNLICPLTRPFIAELSHSRAWDNPRWGFCCSLDGQCIVIWPPQWNQIDLPTECLEAASGYKLVICLEAEIQLGCTSELNKIYLLFRGLFWNYSILAIQLSSSKIKCSQQPSLWPDKWEKGK